MHKFFTITLILILFISCLKPQNTDTFELKKGIFAVNEGNFTYSNASLSFIDFNKDTIYNDIFYKATTYPLGDVAESITLWNGKAFIVINNSGKIFVIDNTTAKYIATINELSSPRYIEIINDTKSYISDLYSPFITIVNPQTYKITGTVNVGHSTEQMLIWNDFIFALNWNLGNKIIKINTQNDQVVDSANVTLQPNSIRLDKNDKLWILCDGGNEPDTNNNEQPALIELNPQTMQIERKIKIGNRSNSPTHLQINKTRDTLYYLNGSWKNAVENGGVFRLSINDTLAPSMALIPQGARLFYSLFLTNDNKIVVSDAIDYVQPGIILIYDNQGNLLNKFKAGIIPGNFAEK